MRQPERMLTERQWRKIAPLLPKLKVGPKGGRPWADNRATLEGILWVLKTGARWRDLPAQYPSPSTCWRRLALWEELGVWERVWRSFLRQVERRRRLHWEECFVDGSFASAKGGAVKWARRSGAKGRSG